MRPCVHDLERLVSASRGRLHGRSCQSPAGQTSSAGITVVFKSASAPWPLAWKRFAQMQYCVEQHKSSFTHLRQLQTKYRHAEYAKPERLVHWDADCQKVTSTAVPILRLQRVAPTPTYRRRSMFSRTLPMNCDCNFWAHSSPQTCSVPSFWAISSSHGQRYNTGT